MTQRKLLSLIFIGSLAASQPLIAKDFCPLKQKHCNASKTESLKNIRGVLNRYETALNSNDITTILALYTKDGVFMPQHSSPKVGYKQIEAAYQNVFKTIKLNISFNVNEVKLMGYRWAYARTTSSGSVTLLSNGKKISESNQELFLLKKYYDGQWKIARYIFTTTNARH